MTMHYYAFGSICRGEVDPGSDIDLLVCSSATKPEFDPRKFSIYTYERLRQLWVEGNPFAWHLHLESRLLFSSDGSDFLESLGKPAEYNRSASDLLKFHKLFEESHQSLVKSTNSAVFNMSCMFLATRNFATCYSFSTGRPIFSRKSPLLVDPKLPIGDDAFDILARARILSTRGYGPPLSNLDVLTAKANSQGILDWMQNLYPTVSSI